MQKHPIVVLVGPSGAGKTALLLEILKRYPNQCAPIKSKVTRPRRNQLDGIFYDFITPVEFENLVAEGRIFQQVTFGGYSYGCDRAQTDAILTSKLGLAVLVQQSITDFESAGYKLHLIQVIPEGHRPRNEAQRLRDDQERAQIPLNYQATIVNSFKPGGFKQAADALAEVIENLLNVTPTLSRASINN